MRYSKQREVVLAVLRSTRCHPDAEWVYAESRKILPNISLGTVYRNLGDLVEAGEAITVETEDKRTRYDGFVNPHAHIVCEGCGKVADVELKPIVAETGWTTTRQKSVFYGRCPDCGKACS